MNPFSNRENPYEYSSLQVNVPGVLANEITKWGKDKIKEEKIYKDPLHKGREKEIHITVLYGIHAQNQEETSILLENEPPFEVSLGQISLFTNNPDFDVLKIEANSLELFYLNQMVRSNVKNTSKFTVYRPHATIAYIKKGSCTELIGKEDFRGLKWAVNTLVFSSRVGHKVPIRLKHSQTIRSAQG